MNFIKNGISIYTYSKIGVADEVSLMPFVDHCDCEHAYICSDAKRCDRTYRDIQSKLHAGDIIVIESLDALSLEPDTLYDELLWLKEHEILLVVAHFPSTHSTNPKENAIALGAIIDTYGKVLVKTPEAIAARSKGGRKNIDYPDNWEELYEKWAAKEITATEFMKQTGLKKGTFYNMLNDYKRMLEGVQSWFEQKYATIEPSETRSDDEENRYMPT